jgi:hypothetical protein
MSWHLIVVVVVAMVMAALCSSHADALQFEVEASREFVCRAVAPSTRCSAKKKKKKKLTIKCQSQSKNNSTVLEGRVRKRCIGNG